MSRNRFRRTGKGPYFVQLEHYLLDCLAYRTLSANAKVVYTELKRRYNGRNNGSLSLSAREAGDAWGATHHTGARALVELQEHGFIEVAEDSDFNRKVHVARTYLLTEVPDDRPGHSRIASKAFMRWLPTPGSKAKTQSHRCDTTVARVRHQKAERAETAANSRMDATVNAVLPSEQSHVCDTYTLSASQRSQMGAGAAPPAEAAPPHKGRAHRSGQAGGSIPASAELAALLRKRSGTHG